MTAKIATETPKEQLAGIILDNRCNSGGYMNDINFVLSSFVKSDFSAYLTSDFLQHSVLDGLVYDDVKTGNNNEITLAASISYPMTDLYIPFTLVISQDGKLSLSKDEDMGELTPMDE